MKVKITKAGDGKFKQGDVVELEQFLDSVAFVLANGGEMPVAVLHNIPRCEECGADLVYIFSENIWVCPKCRE